jgi:enoyl-CoA hydratase/carnithine racemase
MPIMSLTEILYEVRDRIATVTLNRPEKLNAWTRVMEGEVREAMLAAETDPEVRVIILTGAGKGFCAGADMSLLSGILSHGVTQSAREALHKNEPSRRADMPGDYQRKHSFYASLTKPVIAAINGAAAGLGFIIPLYCDLRFASDNARFGTAFARRGLIAEYGAAWMLPRLIGNANALDLMLSARMIGAEEALRMGLVNAVFPAATFLDQVYDYARVLATSVSPRSMAVVKKQVYNAHFQTLEEAMSDAEAEMVEAFQSEDFKEGVAHFLEKRDPRFSGR